MAKQDRAAGATHPGALLAAVGDEVRLRVLGAVALGAATPDDVAAAAGVPAADARRAVARLLGVGALVEGDGGLVPVPSAFAEAAAAVARLRPAPTAEALGATPEQAEVLQPHIGDDGRLASLPTSKAKRAVALDVASQRFDPGRTYPEAEVNRILGELHHDHAAMRRYLVDEGFLERRDGFYWRAGGTFDVDGVPVDEPLPPLPTSRRTPPPAR